MFVAIGILDPQISHFSILKFKLNHEQRKDPLHLFWDIITSMMFNTIGRINQNPGKVTIYSHGQLFQANVNYYSIG